MCQVIAPSSEKYTCVRLSRHLVHHFRVYNNVSKLFSIDFFSKMTIKEKNREIKVLISAHIK